MGPGNLPAFGEHIVERIDEFVNLDFANDQRRKNFHHIHGVPGNLGKNAMLAQHLRHHHLREKHLVDLVQEFPGHLQLEFSRLMEFDADHQAFAADFLDETVFRAQRLDFFAKQCAHALRILHQLLGIDYLERSQAARHREIVPPESR